MLYRYDRVKTFLQPNVPVALFDGLFHKKR